MPFLRMEGLVGGVSFQGVLDQLAPAERDKIVAAWEVSGRLTGQSWGSNDGVTDPLFRLRDTDTTDEENITYGPDNMADGTAIAAHLTNGGTIPRVFKQFGPGPDLEQDTAAQQPLIEQVGGLWVPNFGSTTRVLTTGSTTVFRNTTFSPVEGEKYCIFSVVNKIGNFSTSSYFFACTRDESGQGRKLAVAWTGDDGIGTRVGGAGFDIRHAGALTRNAMNVVMLRWDGSEFVSRVNKNTGAVHSSADMDQDDSPIAIGESTPSWPALYFYGYIPLTIIADEVFSTAAEDQMFDLLMTRYGVGS